MASHEHDASLRYAGYAAWKAWPPERFFACTPCEQRYFDGELRGLVLAGARVLEIGFGNGNFLRYAADRGAAVSGTEVRAEAVESARRHGIPVYRPDLSDAGGGAKFDLVAAFDVLEHMTLDEIAALFETLSMLVAPGGHVVARFPNGQSPLGRGPQYGDHTHRSVLSAPLLMQLLMGKPWRLVRAANPHTVVAGQGPLRSLGVLARLAGRRMIERTVNRLYGTGITLDPNIVVLIART